MTTQNQREHLTLAMTGDTTTTSKNNNEKNNNSDNSNNNINITKTTKKQLYQHRQRRLNGLSPALTTGPAKTGPTAKAMQKLKSPMA